MAILVGSCFGVFQNQEGYLDAGIHYTRELTARFMESGPRFIRSATDSASLGKKTIHDYWRETDLGFNLIEMHDNASCRESRAQFLGCVAMINAMLGMREHRAMLVPRARLVAEPARFSKPLLELADAAIVEVAESAATRAEADSASPLQNWTRVTREREETWATWSALHAARSRLDFDAAIAWVAKNVVKPANEAEVAANGLNAYFANTIDPHTRLTPTKFLEAEAAASSDEYTGIGVFAQKVGRQFVIQQPIAGGPAYRAGVRANDVILRIDGTDVGKSSRDDVLARIKGAAGTEVRLSIQRKGHRLEIPVRRERIQVENVTSRMIEDRGVRVGYVKLLGFDKSDACTQVGGRISALQYGGASRLILDLRGNAGGFVEQARCIANLFLEPGQTVVTLKRTRRTVRTMLLGNEQILRTDLPRLTALPMVTLLDAGSASASELLAGALRDHDRSLILGARSFGKGLVQEKEDLTSTATLYRTGMVFYQPSGRTNHIDGITPDFSVGAKPQPTAEDSFAIREKDLLESYVMTPVVAPAQAAWVPAHPERIREVEGCMRLSGRADRRFKAAADDALAPDLQLLAAQDVAHCLAPPLGQQQQLGGRAVFDVSDAR